MGGIGEDTEGEGEPLYIYPMIRIQGVSRSKFILNQDEKVNSLRLNASEKTL